MKQTPISDDPVLVARPFARMIADDGPRTPQADLLDRFDVDPAHAPYGWAWECDGCGDRFTAPDRVAVFLSIIEHLMSDDQVYYDDLDGAPDTDCGYLTVYDLDNNTDRLVDASDVLYGLMATGLVEPDIEIQTLTHVEYDTDDE